MNDSAALLYGEIRCWSFLGFKGLNWSQREVKPPNPYTDYFQNSTVNWSHNPSELNL